MSDHRQRTAYVVAACLVIGVVTCVHPAAQGPPAPSLPNPSSGAQDLPDATAAEIRKAVDDAIRERLRDSRVVEVETTQAIATRLSEWAKLFGFFIGIPLALFAAWLGAVGFRSYKDVKAVIDRAREDVTRTLQKARKISATAQEEAQQLRSRVQEVSALVTQVQEQVQAQVQDLSQRVASIEDVVKFKASKTLTPELKQRLSGTLSQYYDYLKRVGLSLKVQSPTVVIDGKDLNASYAGPPKNQIVVHPDLIEFPDVALREFTHYVMGQIKPGFEWSNDIAGLESGLADYFPASFNGDPDFGKDIWPIFERNYGQKIPNRNLKHDRSFSEVVLGPGNQHSNGNVWGGAWWTLRDELGREAFDTLLIATWKSFDIAESAKHLNVFPLELIKQDGALNAGQHEPAIRRVFESRGLPL